MIKQKMVCLVIAGCAEIKISSKIKAMRPLTLTRMFAYFTLACYLVVGSAVVRFVMPETVSFSLTTSYFNLLSDVSLKTSVIEEINAPEMKFAEIKIPVKRATPKVVKKIVSTEFAKIDGVKVEEVQVMRTVEKNELPFYEPVQLQKVVMKEELEVNLVTLYKEFTYKEELIAVTEEIKSDEVKTLQASVNEVEPEFFEYASGSTTNTDQKVVPNVAKDKTDTNKKIESQEVEEQTVADLLQEETPAFEKANVVVDKNDPGFFDYSNDASQNVKKSQPKPESVSVANIVAFDYSKAQQDISTQKIPTVSKVSSQNAMPKSQKQWPVKSEETNAISTENSKSKSASEEKKTYPMSLTIQALGTDLKKLENVQNFEVRYQDNLSEITEDYGSGEVKFETELSQPKMTRSIVIIKKGYIPTSTGVVLEAGNSGVSIPLIEEEVLNELQRPYEVRNSVGALLVELDDETEVAKIDVSFGKVIKLNGDLKKTKSEDFRYQLFIGVNAGNAMLSYHRRNGEVVSKIVHVHENEMTFDANYYEDVVNEKVRLYEEDLLAKENSPLIIAADQVRVFATDITAKKINNHTYKMGFGTSHLGGRRYLELNHQSEPVFVGIRDNNHIAVPSENFMRHILSSIEGSRLGNRCLVQVNLTKKAEKFEVASESVGSTLMTYTQVLDSDGKFYTSISDKTRKIIIVGEGQASSSVSQDSKINVKIEYTDGSVQFLDSYCSPNTYLVEQL